MRESLKRIGTLTLRNIEINVFVLNLVCRHKFDGLTEGVMDSEFNGGTAVLGTGVDIGAGHILVLVMSTGKIAHVVFKVTLDTLGTNVGELAIVGNTCGVDANTQLLTIEGDRHIAEVAVGAVIGDNAD